MLRCPNCGEGEIPMKYGVTVSTGCPACGIGIPRGLDGEKIVIHNDEVVTP
mgnify:CR=1 FL=1